MRTGKPAWGVPLPEAARPPTGPTVRDLSPPLAADGRVFVAPADADRVFALDAETGRLLWRDRPFQSSHSSASPAAGWSYRRRTRAAASAG